MRKNELSTLIKFSCYASVMVAVLGVVIAIAKPAKPVISERESVKAELQQAVNQAGLTGLIEIE